MEKYHIYIRNIRFIQLIHRNNKNIQNIHKIQTKNELYIYIHLDEGWR